MGAASLSTRMAAALARGKTSIVLGQGTAPTANVGNHRVRYAARAYISFATMAAVYGLNHR